MEILRKILRAVLVEDGAPGLFAGLAVGQPVREPSNQRVSAASQERKVRALAQGSVRPS
jgi:hypothetical protein